MSNLTVRDLMTTDVISVTQKDSLATVWELMDNRHIRHVPVVDKDGAVEGLISHRDLIRTALHDDIDLPVTERQDLLSSITVEQAMMREIETISPDANISEAGELMLENKFSSLPVTENQTLVGILTEADFVRHVVNS